MEDIKNALDSVVGRLSDQNYVQSLAFYRTWFDIGRTYHQLPDDQIFDTIWRNRTVRSSIDPGLVASSTGMPA